ncbi:MAG: hypothetical protein ABWY31_05020, partial [Pseudoxanthomonas sp.]
MANKKDTSNLAVAEAGVQDGIESTLESATTEGSAAIAADAEVATTEASVDTGVGLEPVTAEAPIPAPEPSGTPDVADAASSTPKPPLDITQMKVEKSCSRGLAA